jgi:hypothetical protein
MKILFAFLCLIAPFTFVYSLLAFFCWNINPGEWSQDVRLACIMFGGPFTCTGGIAALTILAAE